MCEENPNAFDPHLNNIHLQECLKRLLCAYDELCVCKTENDDKDVSINFIKENRPYFESLYIVLNMGNQSALRRGLNLPKMWK